MYGLVVMLTIPRSTTMSLINKIVYVLDNYLNCLTHFICTSLHHCKNSSPIFCREDKKVHLLTQTHNMYFKYTQNIFIMLNFFECTQKWDITNKFLVNYLGVAAGDKRVYCSMRELRLGSGSR